MISLLDNNGNNTLIKVAELLRFPKNIVETLFNLWAAAFDTLHGNVQERPQLLTLIGDKGVELFYLNNVLTTFMVTQLSGVRDDLVWQIQSRLNTLPNFIFNPDGTVTEVLINFPTPTPILTGAPIGTTTLVGGSASVLGTFTLLSAEIIPDFVGIYPGTVTFTPTNSALKTIPHTVYIDIQS